MCHVRLRREFRRRGAIVFYAVLGSGALTTAAPFKPSAQADAPPQAAPRDAGTLWYLPATGSRSQGRRPGHKPWYLRYETPETPWYLAPETSEAPAAPASEATSPAEAPARFTWAPFAMAISSPTLALNTYADGKDRHSAYSRAVLGGGARWQGFGARLLLQSAHNLQRGADPAERLPIGVYEAFAAYRNDTLRLRIGRQALTLGSGRLISEQDEGLIGRSFDLLRLDLRRGDDYLTLLGGRRDLRGHAAAPEDAADWLGALYAHKALSEAHTLEVFLLYRGSRGEGAVRDVGHLGLRALSEEGAFQYDAEAGLQFGERRPESGAESHLAYAAVGELTYGWPVLGELRLGLGGAYASGRSPSGASDAFDSFYPDNAIDYGVVSLFQLSNLSEFHGRAILRPAQGWQLTLSAYLLGLAQTGDRWVGAYDEDLGQVAVGQGFLLGSEYNAELIWEPTPWLYFDLVYGVFVPTPAAEPYGYTRPSHTAWFTLYLEYGELL